MPIPQFLLLVVCAGREKLAKGVRLRETRNFLRTDGVRWTRRRALQSVGRVQIKRSCSTPISNWRYDGFVRALDRASVVFGRLEDFEDHFEQVLRDWWIL